MAFLTASRSLPIPVRKLLSYRREIFENNLKHNRYQEVIHLPDVDEIKKGAVGLGFTGISDFEGLFYTPKEYKAHIENIIRLLQTYENYNLILKKGINNGAYALYVKEDLGAFVFKTSTPYLIFAINESNMTAAFWDYLNSNLGKDQGGNKNKRETINQLQVVIDEL